MARGLRLAGDQVNGNARHTEGNNFLNDVQLWLTVAVTQLMMFFPANPHKHGRMTGLYENAAGVIVKRCTTLVRSRRHARTVDSSPAGPTRFPLSRVFARRRYRHRRWDDRQLHHCPKCQKRRQRQRKAWGRPRRPKLKLCPKPHPCLKRSGSCTSGIKPVN